MTSTSTCSCLRSYWSLRSSRSWIHSGSSMIKSPAFPSTRLHLMSSTSLTNPPCQSPSNACLKRSSLSSPSLPTQGISVHPTLPTSTSVHASMIYHPAALFVMWHTCLMVLDQCYWGLIWTDRHSRASVLDLSQLYTCLEHFHMHLQLVSEHPWHFLHRLLTVGTYCTLLLLLSLYWLQKHGRGYTDKTMCCPHDSNSTPDSVDPIWFLSVYTAVTNHPVRLWWYGSVKPRWALLHGSTLQRPLMVVATCSCCPLSAQWPASLMWILCQFCVMCRSPVVPTSTLSRFISYTWASGIYSCGSSGVSDPHLQSFETAVSQWWEVMDERHRFVYVVNKTVCISGKTIFVITEHEVTNRVLCVNQNGQVLGVSMDKQTIIPYILATLNSMELAFKLEVAVTCLVTLSLLHPSSCCHHLAPRHFVNIMAFVTLSSSPPSTSFCL